MKAVTEIHFLSYVTITSFTTDGPIGWHQHFVWPTEDVCQVTMIAMVLIIFLLSILFVLKKLQWYQPLI